MRNIKLKINKRLQILLGIIALVAIALVGIGAFENPMQLISTSGLSFGVIVAFWIKDKSFTPATPDEIEKMDSDHLLQYSKDLTAHKSKLDANLKLSIEKKANKEDLDKIKAELKQLKDVQVKNLLDVIEKQGIEMKKMTVLNTANQEDSLMTALKSSWNGIKKKFKEDPDVKNAIFTIKALPLTTGTWASSANYPFLQDDQEAGITNEPSSPQTFRNDVPTGAEMTSDTWTWIERGTIIDNTAVITEGNVFGIVEVAYLKKESKVEKIAAHTKITREMMEDWNEFLEAITDLIRVLNSEKLSSELFAKIVSASVEFDANGIEVALPDFFGVIKTALTQIIISGKMGWIGNKIYMNPADVNEQDLSKDSIGNYIFPPFLMPNGTTIKGVTITETTDMPQGFFEVCDITKTRKRFKRTLEIRLWEQNEDDVIRDLLTLTGTLRYAFIIKEIEKAAFVYDSFDAATAILTDVATALAFILAMAPTSDASKLTINLLIKAGVIGLVPDDLLDYKVAVAAQASIADLSALQVVINAA